MHISRGFILKKKPFNESDCFITVFSEKFGKIDIMARGTRKIESKMAPHLHLFDMIELGFVQGKKFRILTAASVIRPFAQSADYFLKNAIIVYLMYFTDKFSFEDEKKEIWSYLEKLIFFMEGVPPTRQKDAEFILAKINYFFLSVNGWKPELDRCCACGNRQNKESKNLMFSQKEGGIICEKCSPQIVEKRIIERETADIISFLSQNNDVYSHDFPENSSKEARKTLEEMLFFSGEEKPAFPVYFLGVQ